MSRGSLSSKWLASLVLAGCWLASIFTPVAVTIGQNGEQVWRGDAILLMGWLGPLMYQFGWFANPLLPAALILAANPGSGDFQQKLTFVVAVVLALFAVNAVFWTQIPMDNGTNPIVRFQIGYYLWLVAMFGAAIWGLASAILSTAPAPGAE